MKNLFYLSIISLLCYSCGPSYEAKKYLTEGLEDTLLYQISVYDAKRFDLATDSTKFDKEFYPYYSAIRDKSSIDYYYIDKDSNHYFLISKPAVSLHKDDRRTVGGRYKVKNNNTIYDYEELFWMPVMNKEEALEKGKELFTATVEKGNITEFLGNKKYIEFPDAHCYFDKKTVSWKVIIH